MYKYSIYHTRSSLCSEDIELDGELSEPRFHENSIHRNTC
jgi:hypothetical protein